MQFLSQRDAKWKDVKLGFSNVLTIGSDGCTITCIGMLAGLTPVEVNDRLKAVGGFVNTKGETGKTDSVLVLWSKIKLAIPWLEFDWRGTTYDNDKVSAAITENGGCLVEVDFDGKISSPRDRHWVLFTGNKKLVDPWTGVDKSTTYYPIVTGFAVIKKIQPQPVATPNTPETLAIDPDQKKTLEIIEQYRKDQKHGSLEGAVRDMLGLIGMLTSFRDLVAKTLNIEGQTDTTKIYTELQKALAERNGIFNEAAAGLQLFEHVIKTVNKDNPEAKTWKWPEDVMSLMAKQSDYIEKLSVLAQTVKPDVKPSTDELIKQFTLLGLLWKIYKVKDDVKIEGGDNNA